MIRGLPRCWRPTPMPSASSPRPGIIHVRVALGISNEENLDAIAATVEAARRAGQEALVDCEHFFDGFKANPDYALACARTAFEAGARWVVLCDTNGGTQPQEIEAIVRAVAKVVPGVASRHPRPQRHRAGGCQFAGRGAGRGAPDPGHAQRHRRALRQCQSRLDHSDSGAQGAVSQPVRDRHRAGSAEDARPM